MKPNSLILNVSALSLVLFACSGEVEEPSGGPSTGGASNLGSGGSSGGASSGSGGASASSGGASLGSGGASVSSGGSSGGAGSGGEIGEPSTDRKSVV